MLVLVANRLGLTAPFAHAHTDTPARSLMDIKRTPGPWPSLQEKSDAWAALSAAGTISASQGPLFALTVSKAGRLRQIM